MTRPAVIYGPWCGGEWVRVSPAQPARPEQVDLSGSTRLPPSPAEKAAPDEPTKLSETDAERRAREAKAATAGWT